MQHYFRSVPGMTLDHRGSVSECGHTDKMSLFLMLKAVPQRNNSAV